MPPQCQCAANITPYPEDVHRQPGSPATSTSESLPNDANPMSHALADEALSPLQSDGFEVPTGIISTVLDPSFILPEGALEHPLYPLPIAAIVESPEDVHLNPGIAVIFESLLQDATSIFQAEEGQFMSPICCFEASMAISATPSTDSPPATNTTTEGGPDPPSYSPPAGSVLGDLISLESWDESQLYPLDPYHSTVASPPPTDLGQDIPVEVIGANSDTNLPPSNLSHRPVHKRRKYGIVHQTRGQATHDHSRVCPYCGQEFYGKLEMVRHFKSRHRPPTIGCRICDYKQSRKDLFKLHCKKHPTESIESLMVPL